MAVSKLLVGLILTVVVVVATVITAVLVAANNKPCNPNPCLNGGSCAVLNNKAVCTCAAGFNGATCENNINECASSPCQNGGTCVDGVNSFTCVCPDGYSGATCNVLPQPAMCGAASARNAFAQAVKTKLTASGEYLATEGEFAFYDISLCEAFGNCFFQNARGALGRPSPTVRAKHWATANTVAVTNT